jgi:hypothetical protein
MFLKAEIVLDQLYEENDVRRTIDYYLASLEPKLVRTDNSG